MAQRVRFFPNPKPDYEPSFGVPEVQQNEIIEFITELIKDIEENVDPSFKNAGDGVYLGTAGISYMFYNLSKMPAFSSQKEDLLSKADDYIQPALSVCQVSLKHTQGLPAFILGPAGIFAVAAALYQAAGDEEESRNNREQFYNIAQHCKKQDFGSFGSDELFVGRAGYILGSLWLAKQTNTPLQKSDIFELCKVTLKSGRDHAVSNHCACPLMYSYHKVEYFGAAHGLSTILLSILSVPGYLDENPGDRDDVKRSIDYLLGLQTEEGNFPSATDDIGKEPQLVHWCHGAGGIFYLMAKAYLVFKDDKYLQSCKKMADLIWQKGLLKKGPGLCHGVAGNGYVFLILYRITREAQHLYRAISFYQFLTSDTFKQSARTPDNPHSLFEGTAGTVCYLADLLRPEQAVFPFSDIF